MEGYVGFLHIWIKLCTDEVIYRPWGGGTGEIVSEASARDGQK